MTRKDEVFATPIGKLNFASDIFSQLEVRFVSKYVQRHGLPPFRSLNVGDVITLMLPYTLGYKPRGCERELIAKLVELGLTRLDCLFLPRKTVTEEALLALSHDELLSLPALALDIEWLFLYAALLPFMEAKLLNEEDIPTVTIRDWLNLFDTKDKGLSVNVSRKVRERNDFIPFRELMRRLGLTDYPFLRLGTEQDELNYVRGDGWHSARQAQMITDYCLNEGFIPPFIK